MVNHGVLERISVKFLHFVSSHASDVCNELLGGTLDPRAVPFLIPIPSETPKETKDEMDQSALEKEYLSLIERVLRWHLLSDSEVGGAVVRAEIEKVADSLKGDSVIFHPSEIVAIHFLGLPDGVRCVATVKET